MIHSDFLNALDLPRFRTHSGQSNQCGKVPPPYEQANLGSGLSSRLHLEGSVVDTTENGRFLSVRDGTMKLD